MEEETAIALKYSTIAAELSDEYAKINNEITKLNQKATDTMKAVFDSQKTCNAEIVALRESKGYKEYTFKTLIRERNYWATEEEVNSFFDMADAAFEASVTLSKNPKATNPFYHQRGDEMWSGVNEEGLIACTLEQDFHVPRETQESWSTNDKFYAWVTPTEFKRLRDLYKRKTFGDLKYSIYMTRTSESHKKLEEIPQWMTK